MNSSTALGGVIGFWFRGIACSPVRLHASASPETIAACGFLPEIKFAAVFPKPDCWRAGRPPLPLIYWNHRVGVKLKS